MKKSWGLFLYFICSISNATIVDAPVIIPPATDRNVHGVKPSKCSWHEGGYDVCIFLDNSGPLKFIFRNIGPNRIVSSGPARAREWSFNLPGAARQDLSFEIADMPNATVSLTQESFFMVFPRKTLPNIRTEGAKQIVTLPTGETVTFNTQTKEVVGGVLSEDAPITQGVRALDPAKVSYRGTGVMIRANLRAEDPRLGVGTATITKLGKACKVPLKDLWPDQSDSSALHFRFPRDVEFDQYLKRKCGFGI